MKTWRSPTSLRFQKHRLGDAVTPALLSYKAITDCRFHRAVENTEQPVLWSREETLVGRAAPTPRQTDACSETPAGLGEDFLFNTEVETPVFHSVELTFHGLCSRIVCTEFHGGHTCAGPQRASALRPAMFAAAAFLLYTTLFKNTKTKTLLDKYSYVTTLHLG